MDKSIKSRGVASAAEALHQSSRAEFIGDVALKGKVYRPADLDVLQFAKVRVVVPRDVEIEHISVTEEAGGKAVVEVADTPVVPEGERAAAAAVDPVAGQAAAEAPYDLMLEAGMYRVTLLGYGHMDAHWERWVTKYDGNSSWNYYGVRRQAYAQPQAPSGGWSKWVTRMYMNSYPKPGYESSFTANLAQAPGGDNLVCGSIGIALPMGPVELSGSLNITCESYDMTIGSPGRYTMDWTNSALLPRGGNTNTAYAQTVRVPQGASVFWSYQQRVEFAKSDGFPPAETGGCSSTNSNQVC